MSEWRTNKRTKSRYPLNIPATMIEGSGLAPADICPFCGRSTIGQPREFRTDRYCHEACLPKKFIVTTLDEGEVEIQAWDLEHAVAEANLRWPDAFDEVIPVEPLRCPVCKVRIKDIETLKMHRCKLE